MNPQSDTFETSSRPAVGQDDRLWPSSCWFLGATVIAFLLFWPLGVAMLAWGIWHRQIRASSWWQNLRGMRLPAAATGMASGAADLGGFARRRPSNEALADYLAREQQRLREEQQKLDDLVQAFEAFKEAERKASDQRDFDAFLRSRGEGGNGQQQA